MPTAISSRIMANTLPLTPIELKNMLGQILTLHEIRKNKVMRKLIPYEHRIELQEVRSIYGSENKCINVRYIDEGFECRTIIMAPDGTSLKNPGDISNTKYFITR